MNTKNNIFYRAKVLILGLGSHPEGSGVAAARFFISQGSSVRITDLKKRTQLMPVLKKIPGKKVTYHLGGHRAADIRWADIIVQNPAVPPDAPELVLARTLGKRIETDLTVLLQRVQPTIIGISGTRGKSTTSALTHHLLRGRFPKVELGGNIGRSPLRILPQLTDRSLIVLELSSWMLDGLARISYSPSIALLTNIYPDHLDWYGSMAAYRRSKRQLFAHQKAGDTAITFAHQPSPLPRRAPQQKQFWFSGTDSVPRGVGVRDGFFVFYNGRTAQTICPITAVPLAGLHNRHNAAAALTIAAVMGVPRATLQRRLTSFKGLPHRLQTVRRWHGITFVNDSHATTPVASAAALRSMTQPVILIAGGVDKDLPFKDFAQEVKRHVHELYLLPGTASRRIHALRTVFRTVPVHSVKTLREAVTKATRAARSGQTILLSPAAASFNQFRNAEERGERFIDLVRHL